MFSFFFSDNQGAVYFANTNWNCLDVDCTSRVAPGTGQPDYGCAEVFSSLYLVISTTLLVFTAFLIVCCSFIMRWRISPQHWS